MKKIIATILILIYVVSAVALAEQVPASLHEDAFTSDNGVDGVIKKDIFDSDSTLFLSPIIRSNPEKNTYMFRQENFTLGADWQVSTVSGSDLTSYVIPVPNFIQTSRTTDSATVNFYVPETSNYLIWAQVRVPNDATKRYGKISIDGVEDRKDFGEAGINVGGRVCLWIKGDDSHRLQKGWHTLSVRAVYPSVWLFGVVVTEDTQLVLNNDTAAQYDQVLRPYEDIISPELSGSISSQYDGDTSMTFTWPQAVDNKEIAGYKLFYNDSEVFLDKEQLEYTVDDVYPLEEIDTKVQALDSHGNMTELSLKAKVSDFMVSDFNITDSLLNPVTKLSELRGSESAYANIGVIENTSGEEKSVLLGISVFNNETGLMVASKRESRALEAFERITDYRVSLELPELFSDFPDNYSVYAALWDTDDNIAPQESGILINE